MIDERVERALNAQINMEFAASYSYLAMAMHLDAEHLTGFSSWMEKQSDEERSHALRLVRYMLDRDGKVELEAIDKPQAEFGSVNDIFAMSLDQEKKNTRSINELYSLAREENDYATQAHLQWFIDEQVEEEKTISDILGRLKLAGDDVTALLMLDQQLGTRPSAGADGGIGGPGGQAV